MAVGVASAGGDRILASLDTSEAGVRGGICCFAEKDWVSLIDSPATSGPTEDRIHTDAIDALIDLVHTVHTVDAVDAVGVPIGLVVCTGTHCAREEKTVGWESKGQGWNTEKKKGEKEERFK